jgi:hypothetical protein
MNDTDYKAVLEKAKADLLKEQEGLGSCLAKQEAHEKRILGLRATIAALSRMLDEEFVEEDALGFTDAIRAAFKSVGTDGSLIPTEVKGRLEMLGYDISRYGNLMASIHTVINRLVSKGEIKQIGTRGDNKPAYQTTNRFIIEDLTMTPPPPSKVEDVPKSGVRGKEGRLNTNRFEGRYNKK